MFTMHRRPWVVACIGIATGLFCWSYLPRNRPDKKEISIAQDEVYEAVVRDMATPAHGRPGISQLVFDDKVLTNLSSEADIKSCKRNAHEGLALESATLPYNSVADKVYRIFARSAYDDSLRADTIQEFLEKSCTVGPLSQTFHTDLPRTFIPAESVHFEGWPVQKDGSRSFEQLFPGASGIISFSRVGFDSTLHEAIVATSFVCGGLCGSGNRNVLRKRHGRWEVVNKWTAWVS
jgi:hypothetical protein